MKPTIGRIVLITNPLNGEQRPAIVTAVWGDGPDASINATAFLPDGSTLGYSSLPNVATASVDVNSWDWPARV